MSEKDFLEKMANVLNVETVNMEDCLGDFDEWDSIAVVAFLMSNAQVSKKLISFVDIKSAKTLKDLFDLI